MIRINSVLYSYSLKTDPKAKDVISRGENYSLVENSTQISSWR